jgi:succinate dehydrogenase/fumarate reductase flavoprotein subunit
MTTWDYTTDVLVVGFGGGGMTAPLDIIKLLK